MKIRQRQEPISELRQAPKSVERSVQDILTQFKNDRSVIRTITEFEIGKVADAYSEVKDQETEVKTQLASLRDLLLAYAQENAIKKTGPVSFSGREETSGVEPIKVAEFILGQGYDKPQLHQVFNAVFSVSLTEFKKYFGQEALTRVGAIVTKKDYTTIRVNKK